MNFIRIWHRDFIKVLPREQLANDRIKTQYAIDNNIPLVRIPYWAVNKINIEMIMGDKYLITKVAD